MLQKGLVRSAFQCIFLVSLEHQRLFLRTQAQMGVRCFSRFLACVFIWWSACVCDFDGSFQALYLLVCSVLLKLRFTVFAWFLRMWCSIVSARCGTAHYLLAVSMIIISIYLFVSFVSCWSTDLPQTLSSQHFNLNLDTLLIQIKVGPQLAPAEEPVWSAQPVHAFVESPFLRPRVAARFLAAGGCSEWRPQSAKLVLLF